MRQLNEKLNPFDWRDILEIPSDAFSLEGAQLFRFITKDKPYIQNEEAKEFVSQHLGQAKRFKSDAEVLKFASEAVEIQNGAFLEMGVCTGKTINFIAALNPHKIIHGFDSFEGLPEDWQRNDRVWKKGSFAFKDSSFLPPVLVNVHLYKGLFKDTLPFFKNEILKKLPIAFLHIDCDLYSSTKDVFNVLSDNFQPGSIIVFDELYNYPGYEDHEWKAFQEFLRDSKWGAQVIAFNENHEQVAVKLVKP